MFDHVSENYTNWREGLRKLAGKINAILDGKTNNIGTVTLTASTTTTTVTDRRIGVDSVVLLEPTTANAAAEIANGTLYRSTTIPGTSFVLTHANNAQTDRTYNYTLIG